jgi:hypothetical protein
VPAEAVFPAEAAFPREAALPANVAGPAPALITPREERHANPIDALITVH